MSILSRVNWVAQQRVDLSDLVAMDSYTAFDIRALISSFVGVTDVYILRGYEVTGFTGLNVSVKISDSLVYNPLDNSGSFYFGKSSETDQIVSLTPKQSAVFCELTFKNISQVPVNRGQWDPMAITGDDAAGKEYTAASDTQNVIELVLSINTAGFSENAVPLFKAVTGPNQVTQFVDCRPLYFRLGSGGANPDSLYKYPWSTARGESPAYGLGVDDEINSPWRSSDSSGILNDKGIRSEKDWKDAVMSRIAEIDGIPYWYFSGLASGPVSGLTLKKLFFDTIGHSLQPSKTSSFKWTKVSGNLTLTGEGTKTPIATSLWDHGIIQWQSNYHELTWELGNTFDGSGATHRNYNDLHFQCVPAPCDGGNIYLLLQRDAFVGSGAAISWADKGTSSFTPNNAVSGNSGDFTGVALGDYIRKESEGYSRYYKVVGMSDGVTLNHPTGLTDSNYIATDAITALLLDNVIASGASVEPFRFFRTKYSSADLVADTAVGQYNYQDMDYYWMGRRVGELFYLRDYGTMQEGEEVTTLDAVWAQGQQSGGEDLVLEHAFNAIYDTATGYKLRSGATTTLITIRRRKTDNTVAISVGDNSGSLLTYTINAPIGLIADGSSLWVRLSDTTGGVLTSGNVTNSTDDINNTDVTTNKWQILAATATPVRSFDNREVHLLCRKATINGNPCLIFCDGSVLDINGLYYNNHMEIQGDLVLTGRAVTAIPFIDKTKAGLVDVDVTNMFYDTSTGTIGLRKFRITDYSLDLSSPGDTSLFANLGANTLTIGGVASTTAIPGNLLVSGTATFLNPSHVISNDKLLTLGVGDPLNGGNGGGLEVADNTQQSSQAQLYIGPSPDPHVVDITVSSTSEYVLGSSVVVEGLADLGNISSGQITGEYTVVTTATAYGQAQVMSPTVLRIWTAGTALANAVYTNPTPQTPLTATVPWSIRLSDSSAAYSGITSWAFRVKNIATAPTITPVLNAGVVPTIINTDAVYHRIPFLSNDTVGPGNTPTTLDFSAALTFIGTGVNATTYFKVDGNITPLSDGNGNLGDPTIQWSKLYLFTGASNGIRIGSSSLYENGPSALKASSSLELVNQLILDTYEQFIAYGAGLVPATLPTGSNLNVFSRDGLVYQQDFTGGLNLLTNTNTDSNVYEEIVSVVSSPSGNNQMGALVAGNTITLPMDSRHKVGDSLSLMASVSNGLSVVTVTRTAHGLTNGTLITVITSSAIGGISAMGLSVVNAPITYINANSFSFLALASATSNDSGRLGYMMALVQKTYRAGQAEFTVSLNGQTMHRGIDYLEVGGSNLIETQVTWQRNLSVSDVIVYRAEKA